MILQNTALSASRRGADRADLLCHNGIGKNREDMKIQELTDQRKAERIPMTPEKRLAVCAVKALLYEVSVTPKPGLVDRADCGCHQDMDFFTFLDSAVVLSPYFEICAAAGRKAAAADFPAKIEEDGRQGQADACASLLAALRGPGLQAEAAMYEATGGVNTHKGAIFLLGLLTAAGGYCLEKRRILGSPKEAPAAGDKAADAGKKLFYEDVLAAAGRIAAPSLGDFTQTGQEETAGLQQYRENACTGIRGEAAAGLPSLRDFGLPVLQKALREGAGFNDAGVEALLALILTTEDTTLLKRCGSRKKRDEERKILRDLLKEHSPLAAAALLNERWIRLNYSAGGCADLLGAACFLLFAEKEFI